MHLLSYLSGACILWFIEDLSRHNPRLVSREKYLHLKQNHVLKKLARVGLATIGRWWVLIDQCHKRAFKLNENIKKNLFFD